MRLAITSGTVLILFALLLLELLDTNRRRQKDFDDTVTLMRRFQAIAETNAEQRDRAIEIAKQLADERDACRRGAIR